MITVSIEHALASGCVTTGQLVASGEITEASSPILRTEPADSDDLQLAALVQARRLARFAHVGKTGAVRTARTPTPLPSTSTTRAGYSYQLESLRREHGHRSVAGMTRENIKKLLDPDKPGAALARLKAIRVLIRHGIEIGWLTSDPSLGIKRPKGGEIRSWTEAEIATFEAHWPIGSEERLGFAVMLFTGQRRSDVFRMVWSDVTGDTIKVVQQKTLAKLTIPLHPELRVILAVTKREHVAMLVNGWSRAFTVKGFSAWMREAITAAGLPLDAQPHGLRKAAGRRLAEAGCSANEIMAILGHKSLVEATRYTREADQVRLASAAIERLTTGQNRHRIAQTSNDGFEQLEKNAAIS